MSVSRRINRPEQALSTRLFKWSSRGFRLIIVGERLVAHAERMEREVESFVKRFWEPANGP